jgi:transcriptional regulator with XRE-family HTH domain
MSQRELARRLGVNPSRVCDWERGKRCPTATRIEDIAIALGLTVAGFYRPERASKDDQTRRGESENVESAENRG